MNMLLGATVESATSLVPDGVLGFVLLDLLLILVAARLFGGLALRFGQPRVVGEIVAGVALGPSLLGPALFRWGNSPGFLSCTAALGGPAALAKPGGPVPSISGCLFPPQALSILGVLGALGLALFMFLVGLEFDPKSLNGKLKGIASVSLGAVAAPIAAAFVVAPMLYNVRWVGGFGTDAQPQRLAFTLFVAAILSVSAFPVMARILQEKGLLGSDMGAVGVAAAAVVTILMFLLVAVAKAVAADAGTGATLVRIGAVGLYLVVMVAVVRPALASLGERVTRAGEVDAHALAVSLGVLFASAYAAHRLGVNVIVGGFVAGAVMPARTVLGPALGRRLTDLVGVALLPIFLAVSGLRTDFSKLRPTHFAGLVLILAAGVISKWAAGAVAGRLGGLSWGEANVLGVLLNCRGLLVLVVGLVALDAKVISPTMQVAGVVVALVTTVMTGPLFDRATRAARATPSTPATADSKAG